jgi:hypothetical protein
MMDVVAAIAARLASELCNAELTPANRLRRLWFVARAARDCGPPDLLVKGPPRRPRRPRRRPCRPLGLASARPVGLISMKTAEEVFREADEAAAHGASQGGGRIGPPNTHADDVYSVENLRTETFPVLKRIAGDIVVEGLTLLASRPKVGKTWLAIDIAIAVATGGYCLGDIKCEQGDVLLCALEDNKRRMQRRLTKILGANKAEWPCISCAHTWPRANAGGLERIRAWIEKASKPRLVVIDVLARFRKLAAPGKQSYDIDYEAIAELQKIASDTGIAILVIHHTRKGEADDPIDAVSGTLGLAGAADAVLVIDRKAQGVRLYGRSRDVDEIDKALEFNRETCRWTILGETADIHRTKERQEILDALESGPMSLKDIAAAVGKSVSAAFNLLDRLAKAGEVTRTERGHYARSYNPHVNGVNVEMNPPWWNR